MAMCSYVGRVKVRTYGKAGVGSVVLRWKNSEYCFLLIVKEDDRWELCTVKMTSGF